MKNPKALTVILTPDKTPEQAVAEVALNPAVNAATVVDTYQKNIMGDDVDTDALVATLRASMDRSVAGDTSGLEAMLIGQATALQTIFVSLAKRAHHQQFQQHLEAFLGLALKAQAQSRATIQAVIDLKFPRQATFVKQANIAHGPQQVNNAPAPKPHPPTNKRARAGKTESAQTELLEQQHGERMDTGKTGAAGGADPHMETMEAVHRPQNTRRESQGSKQRRQGRSVG